MRQLNKVQTIIYLLGAVCMTIGAGTSLLAWVGAPYVYCVGALGFASMQMLQRYDGQSFVIRRITIQKMAVVAILAAFVIIVLTTILIALTPLRVYIPGYTSQKDYKMYKQTAARVDSLEKQLAMNQQFIENFSGMLEGNDGAIYEDDEAQTTPDVHPVERDPSRGEGLREVLEEAEMILGRVGENSASNNAGVPGIEQAKITSISIYPPAMGAVTRLFDASQNHYGIDITPTGCTSGVVCASSSS